MKSRSQKKSLQKARPTLVALWQALALLLIICTVLFFAPKILSTDPCFDDWDIACTYAPSVLQKLGQIDLLVAVIAFYIVIPSFLVVSVVRLLRRANKGSK